MGLPTSGRSMFLKTSHPILVLSYLKSQNRPLAIQSQSLGLARAHAASDAACPASRLIASIAFCMNMNCLVQLHDPTVKLSGTKLGTLPVL